MGRPTASPQLTPPDCTTPHCPPHSPTPPLFPPHPTGDVVLEHTWKTCILPEGSYKGTPVGPDDVIELQRGGTGFAAHDKSLQVTRHFTLGPGSGLADLRGQHHGPTSKFGLRFNN